MVTKERSELFEAVQTTSSDHIKKFFGRKRDGCRLNRARAVEK